MKALTGFRGLIFNAVLFGLVFLLSSFLEKMNVTKDNFILPLYISVLGVVLLPIEYRANIYILATEFQILTARQRLLWKKFIKTWYFGILLLMVIIWRTYFKMELILMPVWYASYDFIGLNYHKMTWKGKLPVYLSGITIFYYECLLIGHTLIPGEAKYKEIKVWFSSLIVLLFMTFFTTGLIAVFQKEFIGMTVNNLWPYIPISLIVFTFFYVPLRWVEVISDMIDCQNIWQLWLFWISTFIGMILMFIKT